MIAVLFDTRADTFARIADLSAEPPNEPRTVKAVIVRDGELTVCGWLRQASNRRWLWMEYPPGMAADIADDMVDGAPADFFTPAEIRAIGAAAWRARS